MTPKQLAAIFWIKLHYRRNAKHLFADENGRVSVSFHYTQISNLKPLKGLHLNKLGLYGTPVRQWSDLAEINFLQLDVGATTFDSLTHIAGKPLTQLEMHCTPVSSIHETKGMPLRHLQIGGTRVKDFSPISNLPLKSLFMSNCETNDLSFLDGLDLTHFAFTFNYETKGLECLRRMRKLISIMTTDHDAFTPNEFWHRFENKLPMDDGYKEFLRFGERLSQGKDLSRA